MYNTLYNRKPFSNEEEKEIIDNYLSGKSLTFLSKQFNCSTDPIKRILKKYHVKLRHFSEQKFIQSKYLCDHNYFKEIDTHEKAYFLGLLMADGCVNKKNNTTTLALHKKDVDVLEIFKLALNSNAVFYDEKGCYSFRIHSPMIKKDLINLGCVPAKSLILDFPELKNKFIWSFILGYFDGDGCACLTKEGLYTRLSISIVSANPFISKLSDFLKNEGIKSLNIKKLNQTSETNSTLEIRNTNDCMLFYTKAYENASFWMGRKRRKIEDFLKSKISMARKNQVVLNSVLYSSYYLIEDGQSSIKIEEGKIRNFLKDKSGSYSRYFTISNLPNGGIFNGLFIKRIRIPYEFGIRTLRKVNAHDLIPFDLRAMYI